MGPHPLKITKNTQTSGPSSTHSGKTSSNEWVYTPIRTHTHTPHTHTPHTPTRPHAHTPTLIPRHPDTHAPSIPPKKISKAIYIAPSAFQKHKSFLLPQKRNGEPLLEKKQGARRFRNGTYLVYSFFNLLSKAALLAMIILSHSMRETERLINMPFAKDERFL